MAGDLDFQVFSTVQNKTMVPPATIASANVVVPVAFLTILTGNVVIKTITPPLTGLHMLAFQFAGVAGVDATGNIFAAKASVVGEVMLLVFNPVTAKYLPVG